MPCNWGVLGAGFIANRAVIPAIQYTPDTCVLAIASRDEQRATSTASQFAIERVYRDYQSLLDDPHVQVVYIALPNHLHREWTIRAAQAGKHVLCEKPLAVNAAECDEMILACRQAKILLMEAVMYRFHPRIQALKHMLESGEAGELRFIHTAFTFPFNAPTNYRAFPGFCGGALLDIGSYCVNAACWLTGSEPRFIASAFSYSHNSIDISTSAVLGFGENLSAHIQCSFAAAEHQVIEVVGTHAAITAPLAFTAWKEDTTSLMIQRGSEFEQKVFVPADPYQLMVQHFTDCIQGRAALLYPPEDGKKTLHVLDLLRHDQVPG